jgi:hypothetical protein
MAVPQGAPGADTATSSDRRAWRNLNSERSNA